MAVSSTVFFFFWRSQEIASPWAVYPDELWLLQRKRSTFMIATPQLLHEPRGRSSCHFLFCGRGAGRYCYFSLVLVSISIIEKCFCIYLSSNNCLSLLYSKKGCQTRISHHKDAIQMCVCVCAASVIAYLFKCLWDTFRSYFKWKCMSHPMFLDTNWKLIYIF